MYNLINNYHSRDGEIPLVHFLCEPVDLPAGVAEDDGLRDGERLVQIAQGVQLPLLALHGHVELTDTLEGKFLLLDEDANGVTHEVGGDLEHFSGHGSREEDDLDVRVEISEDIVDLILETTRQHLVGLVEDEHLDVGGPQDSAGNHVKDTAGGSYIKK